LQAEAFAGCHNIREKDTIDQMVNVLQNMDGNRLEYYELASNEKVV